ncbi:oligosaccharide flippase family protein [Glacieibacterium sp.]|uniref:oligosaccharide flippase family protein n=1 Tax=Glacieibacterium sp. TaxID=2860237 RepID=UPI003B00C125
MAVRRNILANYFGQGVTAVLGLAFVPVYIHYLTMEAYALVGLFALVQAWLALLDLGMTPTLSREMARYTAGVVPVQFIRNLLRSLEILCAIIAVIVAAGMILSSSLIATHWLRVDKLPVSTVAHAMTIMAIVVALRFCEGIYRSALIGLQQQVWYNGASVVLASLRSGGAVAVLAFVAPTPEAFFLWQGFVSMLTLVVFGLKLYLALPAAPKPARFTWSTIVEVRRFAGSMIGFSILAVLMTQVDKLLLSRLMPLESFGYYMLASTVSGVIFMIVAPITQAIYPAFVRQAIADDVVRLRATYHTTAQLACVVIAPAAALLAAFPMTILFAWSNNARLATVTAPALAILAIGNFINGIMQVPLQLQLAYGWTRLVLTVNICGLVLLMPTLLWAVPRFGALAAAGVWTALNVSNLLIQLPLMHRRLLKGEQWRWYIHDVCRPILGALLIVVPAVILRPDGLHDRLGSLFFLVLVGAGAMAGSVLMIPPMRQRAFTAFRYAAAKALRA